MPAAEPCIAVVLSTHNDVTTIEAALHRVLASPWTAEVIVVDDGSADGTGEALARIDDERVRSFNPGVTLGRAAAVRLGLAEATAPFVIVQDADLRYDPADHGALVAPLIAGVADVVFGSRYSPRPHRVLPLWPTVADKVVTLLSNATTDLNLTDATTGVTALRREVARTIHLDQDRVGLELELAAKAAAGRCRVYEVGISYAGRPDAEDRAVHLAHRARELACIVRHSWPGPRATKPRWQSAARRESVAFHEADAELADSLDNLDDAEHYADWITEMLAPHIRGSIIEIGAGHGTMSERLARLGRVTASEPSDRAAERLRRRFAGDPRVTVEQGTAAEVMAPGQYDAAVLINVLEHIPDDVGALADINRGLRPGGTVAVFVPAHEALYSAFDHLIGHQRRYRRSTLATALTRAGFTIDEIRYVNLPGLVAWFVVARVLGRAPTDPTLAALFDRVVVPALRQVERRWTMPSGVSLLAIAHRPATPPSPPTPTAP